MCCLLPAAAHILAVCPDTSICLNISTITSDPSLLSPRQINIFGPQLFHACFGAATHWQGSPYSLGRRQSILRREPPVTSEDRSQLGRGWDRWSVLGEARSVEWGHASPTPALHRPTVSWPVQKLSTVSLRRSDSCLLVVCRAELQTRVCEDLTITFSCLNARGLKVLIFH